MEKPDIKNEKYCFASGEFNESLWAVDQALYIGALEKRLAVSEQEAKDAVQDLKTIYRALKNKFK